MTSQKDIQSLIADLDSILPKPGSRLPWSKPSEVTTQRQVLERVRNYLVSQQHNFVADHYKSPTPTTPIQAEVVQQIVQAVTQEMDVLRSDLMQPLQAEIDALRQQRESLIKEIQQLERTKQQMDSITQLHTVQQQIVAEFSQGLISRCTESLTQQLAEVIANLEAQLLSTESTTGPIVSTASNRNRVGRVMQPQERLEQLQQVQAQSDQLLLTLDTNQRAIFEALQRNLQSYQESLSQGLEKMHNLGTQGEMLFTALVNRLAQQLGREASTILHSSVPSSDVVRQTNQVVVPLTPLETQLPNVVLAPLPHPFGGTQTPRQPIEQLPPKQNAIASFTTQELAPTESDSSIENVPLEHPNFQDWEIVEGLDFENAGTELDNLDSNDEFDTFIQLDIDASSSASLPSVEDINQQSLSTSDELDSWFDQVNEQSPTDTSWATQAGWDEAPGLDKVDEATEHQGTNQNRRQEINDLYESLFGTDSLTSTETLDHSDASKLKYTPTSSQIPTDEAFVPENPSELTDGETNAMFFDQVLQTSSLEDVLFEGFIDPATEVTQLPSPDGSANQLPASWEDLFFEDLAAPSPLEVDLAVEASNSLSNQENASEQESLKTISVLTDLFEEMGLSYSPPAAKAESVVVLTQQPESQPPDSESLASLVEDNYIPALPEEDLLATDILENEPDIEICLDQDTLQQLSEDLYSFEESLGHDFQRQQPRLPNNDFASPPVTPVNQQNPLFSMPEELLAEDWEEYRLQGLADSATDNADQEEPEQFESSVEEATPTSTNSEILGNRALALPESVELDFEPDLFPSEALELDQENALRMRAAASEELAIPEELNVFDDETFIEMQWDEPADSTSEEVISSLESDSSLDETLNSQPEETVNEAMPGDLIIPESTSLTKDQPSDNLTKEAQLLNKSNFDTVSPQSEDLNQEQPDEPKKKDSESDLEANP